MYAVQDRDHPAHQPVAQTGLRGHCATFSAFAHTRTDDQVGASFAYGCQHHRQVSGIIAPVSIHKNDKLSPLTARRPETFQASKTVASCRFAGDQHARISRYGSRRITTPIVNDNNPLRKIAGEFCKQTTERCFFIQGWYNNSDPLGDHDHLPSLLPYLILLAHPQGGKSPDFLATRVPAPPHSSPTLTKRRRDVASSMLFDI